MTRAETSIRIELQVIGSALRSVAEEMGAALVRSAFVQPPAQDSAHVRERLGLVLPVDLDVAHGALLFVLECSGQRGWI